MKKIISIYYIVLGLGIISLWVMLYLSDQIVELQSNKIEILFHISIEVIMGILCILSGIVLLKHYKHKKEITILSSGMILYSVVNSSGYYAQLGNISMIIMFFIITILTLLSFFYIMLEV